MAHTDPDHAHDQRVALADALEQYISQIVERWLGRISQDAAAAQVPLTDLRDGIADYLHRLADLLRGSATIEGLAASAWADVASEHALTRVRLGFDVTQLFQELDMLRRITTQTLFERGVAP